MIYTLTVLYIKDKKIVDRRCWGYFFKSSDAERCIMENGGDIYEQGSYNYAVIEGVPEGILTTCEIEKWYYIHFNIWTKRSNYEGDTYVIKGIEKPEFLKRVVGFAMG